MFRRRGHLREAAGCLLPQLALPAPAAGEERGLRSLATPGAISLATAVPGTPEGGAR